MNTVLIGVCTAKRPQMLRRCLESLAAQQVPDDVSPVLAVIDNEAEPNNRAAVEAFAEQCPFPVRYIHEPRPGIAVARNKALETAESLGAVWIAFTDDDCQVESDWLYWLVRAAEWYETDIVTGHRTFIYPEGTPAWLCRKERSEHEGKPVESAPTNNVIVSRRLFALGFDEGLRYGEDNDFVRRALQLRFDERLTFGSDNDFARQAICHGARIVYSAKPVVWEDVPPERVTLGYRLRIAYRFAMGNANRDLHYGHPIRPIRKAAWAAAVEAPFACVKLILALIVLPFNRERAQERTLKYASKLAGTAGKVVGLFGRFGDPYRTIDGC